MKKICELCKKLARTHCESDRASLCWSCDYKVHSANFLVARHSRTLLCQICQSPTPWTATGLGIGPTVSVCDTCLKNCNKISGREEIVRNNEEEDEEMESTDYYSDDEEEGGGIGNGEDEVCDSEEEEEEEETDCEDNQVVPWSPSTPPPASTANSSSSSDEGSYASSSSSSVSSLSSPPNRRDAQRKRPREDTDRFYNVGSVSSPSPKNADAPPPVAEENNGSAVEEGTVDSINLITTMVEKSLKKQRIWTDQLKLSESRELVIVEFIKKLQQQQQETVSGETISQLIRLSEEEEEKEDPLAVDYDSST